MGRFTVEGGARFPIDVHEILEDEVMKEADQVKVIIEDIKMQRGLS